MKLDVKDTDGILRWWFLRTAHRDISIDRPKVVTRMCYADNDENSVYGVYVLIKHNLKFAFTI